jgi:hypothetical protein
LAQNLEAASSDVYLAVPLALSHALIVGTDFGFSRPPDVKAEPDAGSLIAFSVVCASWLILFWLRRRGVRWHQTRVSPF